MLRLSPCVERYNGNYKVKSFSCWDQLLSMTFAQLTYRESLRDIETCLRAAGAKLYHMGIRGKVSRNTLAHANEVRNCLSSLTRIRISDTLRRENIPEGGVRWKTGSDLAESLSATGVDRCVLEMFTFYGIKP